MAKVAWPGRPAPLALICATTGAAALSASLARLLLAAFSAYGPAFGAATNTYLVTDPAAGALVVGVEPAPAPLFAPALVRWTTSSTITTTPTTEESRYRT